jgi:hypothetical protein
MSIDEVIAQLRLLGFRLPIASLRAFLEQATRSR